MQATEDKPGPATLLPLTTMVVCAFVSNNAVPLAELPGLISRTYEALENISLPQMPAEQSTTVTAPVPAVPIKKSIADDYLVCLEDGKRFKSLKRHLMSHYNLTPDAYRARWGLGTDYPMVAPNYAKARSELALKMGLGQQRKKALAAKAPTTKGSTRKPVAAAA